MEHNVYIAFFSSLEDTPVSSLNTEPKKVKKKIRPDVIFSNIHGVELLGFQLSPFNTLLNININGILLHLIHLIRLTLSKA